MDDLEFVSRSIRSMSDEIQVDFSLAEEAIFEGRRRAARRARWRYATVGALTSLACIAAAIGLASRESADLSEPDVADFTQQCRRSLPPQGTPEVPANGAALTSGHVSVDEGGGTVTATLAWNLAPAAKFCLLTATGERFTTDLPTVAGTVSFPSSEDFLAISVALPDGKNAYYIAGNTTGLSQKELGGIGVTAYQRPRDQRQVTGARSGNYWLLGFTRDEPLDTAESLGVLLWPREGGSVMTRLPVSQFESLG